MRRIFVGDIQGCLPQLDELLVRLKLRSRDQFYCVGDLVNRGPDSLGVLRRLRDIDARTVLGNHDLHLLRLASGHARRAPNDCLRPVLDAADAPQLIAWLREQPIMRVEDDVVLVHAGLHPAWTDPAAIAAEINEHVHTHIEVRSDERIEFATAVRYCDTRGRRPARDDPPPGMPFFPWDHFYRGSRTVVFGHWARRGLVWQARLRGLDTGCVYGGPLSAWIAEEDRLVQVSGGQEG